MVHYLYDGYAKNFKPNGGLHRPEQLMSDSEYEATIKQMLTVNPEKTEKVSNII